MENRKTKGRDKLKMAWRHKSRSEKNLIRFIGFLSFALVCFIVAVIAMDLGFKAKIKRLEDEINDLKTDGPNTTLPESTSEGTLTSEGTMTSAIISTISSSSPSSTVAPSPSEPPPSSSSESSTGSDSSTGSSEQSSSSPGSSSEESTTTGMSSSTAIPSGPSEALFETLRALLTNFSGMKTSARTIEKSSRRGSVTSRSQGTFIIMADIKHEEESESATPDPSGTQDPFVYIDNNGSASGSEPEEEEEGENVHNATVTSAFDSLFDDDAEIDFESQTRDGSGDGNRESLVNP